MYNEKTWIKEYLQFVEKKIHNSKELEEISPPEIMILYNFTPNDYLINVFKKWTIEIDLNENEIIPDIYFGNNNLVDKYYYLENNDIKIIFNKKFNKYKIFLKEVMEYIRKFKNNIKIKTIIRLVIKPNIDGCWVYNDEDFYEFENIQCISSFEFEGQIYKFIDKNILVNGINGKSPGFIFLINELCNTDYSI